MVEAMLLSTFKLSFNYLEYFFFLFRIFKSDFPPPGVLYEMFPFNVTLIKLCQAAKKKDNLKLIILIGNIS